MSKINFFEKKGLGNTIRVSNSLDPDPTRHFVGSDLGPKRLQRVSEDDTSRESVNNYHALLFFTSSHFLSILLVFVGFLLKALLQSERKTVYILINWLLRIHAMFSKQDISGFSMMMVRG